MALRKITSLVSISCICLLLLSCTVDPLDVDVSDVNVALNVKRMDKALFENEVDQTTINNLRLEYGIGFDIFEETVLLPNRSNNSASMENELDRFTEDGVMSGTYKSVIEKYGELTETIDFLENAFKHVKYYYPNAVVPDIIVVPSAFNFGVTSIENVILISLEMYLGAENEYIAKIPAEYIPNHIKALMKKEFLVTDIMRSWIDYSFLSENPETDFLGNIIRQGKIAYALRAFLRDHSEETLLRYTKEQLTWCKDNESNIWNYIVTNEYLFSANQNIIQQFIGEAPFTTGLPQDSPSRVGIWMGWKIIQAYVEENPDIGLVDLLSEEDDNKILRSYKPNK